MERTAWLMGTRATVLTTAEDRSEAVVASEAALDAMAAVEGRLSTWREDSELSRLNRASPGSAVEPSPDVAGLLAEIAGWAEVTGGAFHPAVGALVDAWDLRGEGRVPDEAEIRAALAATGFAGVLIDNRRGSVLRRAPGAWLDAGGFGKGAALREARRALQATGAEAARVDLGGQILLVGPSPSEVAIAHPTDRSRPVARVSVHDVSVATSGQSERGIEVDGQRFGHLLDPRTGRPVPPWGSVTVVHDDPVAADVLATALFVLGPVDGHHLATSLGVAALFVVNGESGVSPHPTPAFHFFDFTPSESPE